LWESNNCLLSSTGGAVIDDPEPKLRFAYNLNIKTYGIEGSITRSPIVADGSHPMQTKEPISSWLDMKHRDKSTFRTSA